MVTPSFDEPEAQAEMEQQKIGTEEGDVCNRDGCTGRMGYPPPEDCSCHINPPCAACVSAELTCEECGETASRGEDRR